MAKNWTSLRKVALETLRVATKDIFPTNLDVWSMSTMVVSPLEAFGFYQNLCASKMDQKNGSWPTSFVKRKQNVQALRSIFIIYTRFEALDCTWLDDKNLKRSIIKFECAMQEAPKRTAILLIFANIRRQKCKTTFGIIWVLSQMFRAPWKIIGSYKKNTTAVGFLDEFLILTHPLPTHRHTFLNFRCLPDTEKSNDLRRCGEETPFSWWLPTTW